MLLRFFFVGSLFLSGIFAQAKKNDISLVDVTKVIPTIKIDCVYASKNNFTKQQVYSCPKSFLRPEVARDLKLVQQDLKKMGLGLLLWDAFRPIDAQKKFWELVPDERYIMNPYVINPVTGQQELKGGRHTRGTAVDVTLIDLKTGKQLEMPTGFDDFSERAWSNDQQATALAKKNRTTLAQAMEKRNFVQAKTEWWHFDHVGWENKPVLYEVTWDDLV